MQAIGFLLLAFFATVTAFSFNSRLSAVPCLSRVANMKSRSVLMMSDDSDDDKFEPEFKPEDPKLFDMNRIVRLGRSRDQDGKSNIWSIEPKMVVVEDDSESGGEGGGGGSNKNLVVFGVIIAAAFLSLPLFTFFSTLVPDPADF